MLHAEGSANETREALADAVRAIDIARGSLRRRNPAEAVSRWRALVSAQWSLVDQFETDGKRYLVAKTNTAKVPSVNGLTPRKSQVVAHAALGHHNKLIAYELGIGFDGARSAHACCEKAECEQPRIHRRKISGRIPLRNRSHRILIIWRK